MFRPPFVLCCYIILIPFSLIEEVDDDAEAYIT